MSKTFYHRAINVATGAHATPETAGEVMQSHVPGLGATTLFLSLSGGESAVILVLTTAAGHPDSAGWPTGTYRCVLEVASAGVDCSYGLRATGGVSGHFARVNNGLLADLETKPQAEAMFSGTGVKIASYTGSWFGVGGSASDRFECAVAGTRAASHGGQSVDFVVDATDASVANGGVSVGPWSLVTTHEVDGNLAVAANRVGAAASDKPVTGDLAVAVDLIGAADVITPAVEISGDLAVTADRISEALAERDVDGTLSITTDRAGAAEVGRVVVGDLTVAVDRTGEAAGDKPIAGDRVVTVDRVGAADTVAPPGEIAGDLAVTVDRVGEALAGKDIDGTLSTTVDRAGEVVGDKPVSGGLAIAVDQTGEAGREAAVGGVRAIAVDRVGMASVSVVQEVAGNFLVAVDRASVAGIDLAVAGDLAVVAGRTGDIVTGKDIIGDRPVTVTLAGAAEVERGVSGDLSVVASRAGATAVTKLIGGDLAILTAMVASTAADRLIAGALPIAVGRSGVGDVVGAYEPVLVGIDSSSGGISLPGGVSHAGQHEQASISVTYDGGTTATGNVE